jgi:hypothetical protein
MTTEPDGPSMPRRMQRIRRAGHVMQPLEDRDQVIPARPAWPAASVTVKLTRPDTPACPALRLAAAITSGSRSKPSTLISG